MRKTKTVLSSKKCHVEIEEAREEGFRGLVGRMIDLNQTSQQPAANTAARALPLCGGEDREGFLSHVILLFVGIFPLFLRLDLSHAIEL